MHHILSKSVVKARPSVLWCYKKGKDSGFSSHRQKQGKKLQKRAEAGKVDFNNDDPFELFVLSTNIRYCFYNETSSILGNTYGMCVLQVNYTMCFIKRCIWCIWEQKIINLLYYRISRVWLQICSLGRLKLWKGVAWLCFCWKAWLPWNSCLPWIWTCISDIEPKLTRYIAFLIFLAYYT